MLMMFPKSERMGDRLQYALPIAGAACAMDIGDLKEMFGRYATGLATVHIFKNALPDQGLNQRPNGGGNGFPSGHTFSATYGASYLARQCSERVPYLGIGVTLAAGFTAASRAEADKHTAIQVLWGAIFALVFDRAFQSSQARSKRDEWLKKQWSRIKNLYPNKGKSR